MKQIDRTGADAVLGDTERLQPRRSLSSRPADAARFRNVAAGRVV